MRRAIRWTLAGGAVALSAGVGVAWPASWWVRSGAVEGWLATLPPIVVEQPSLSLVELGLLGVILAQSGLLVWVLARDRFSPRNAVREKGEARMVQDLFRGFVELEARMESLETAVLRRAGRAIAVPPVN